MRINDVKGNVMLNHCSSYCSGLKKTSHIISVIAEDVTIRNGEKFWPIHRRQFLPVSRRGLYSNFESHRRNNIDLIAQLNKLLDKFMNKCSFVRITVRWVIIGNNKYLHIFHLTLSK